MGYIGLSIAVVLLVSSIISSLAVVLILKLSHKYGWYDSVDERKIHKGKIPRLAGIGFAVTFFIIVLIISFLFKNNGYNIEYLPCLYALFLILVFGVIDDFCHLAPRYKLTIQFIATLLIFIPGYIFGRLTFSDMGILPVPLWYILTLVWVVVITNAINLIDGIDGLAGGLSCLIAISFGLVFFFNGSNPLIFLYCAAFVGVLIGFLVFNLPIPKAKIFMGDCGSQFLGFFIALLPLLERNENSMLIPLPYAVALLLIPILDIIAAVWRRLRDGIRIFSPDKSHIHHKLLNIGLCVQGVLGVLYGLQIIIGVLVLISIRLEGILSLLVLGGAYLVVIVFFSVIHYKNRAVNKARSLNANITPPPQLRNQYGHQSN